MGDIPCGLCPDFRCGCFIMCSYILCVIILIGEIGVWMGGGERLCPKLGGVKIMQSVGILTDYDVCACFIQKCYLLFVAPLRYIYLRTISQFLSDYGYSQAAIATARFQENTAKFNFLPIDGMLNHKYCRAIFCRHSRIMKFLFY